MPTEASTVTLSSEFTNFFSTFGYLQLSGLYADTISSITAAFDKAVTEELSKSESKSKDVSFSLDDHNELLKLVLDDRRVDAIASGLVGSEWQYIGGNGNSYQQDTSWHYDSLHSKNVSYIKIVWYLDPIEHEEDTLRLIPGSHRPECFRTWGARNAQDSQKLWGIDQQDVPSIGIESEPTDMIVLDHNLIQGSFGGEKPKRMITVNISGKAKSAEDKIDLGRYLRAHYKNCELAWRGGSEQRRGHLKLVMDLQGLKLK